ncbi:MAG: ThiF family adenylyltransferase [Ignavibacteriae bacterium]|nr:ThiF family adenylyltransferase [Ignavibacteriota bacterium]
MNIAFNLTDSQHDNIKKHLFSGDNKEAVSIILCGCHSYSDTEKFFVHKIFSIPFEEYLLRTNVKVKWSTDFLKPILEEAEKKKLSVFKIHNHDKIYSNFSEIDDESDKKLFPQIYNWLDSDNKHGSLIMFSDGKIIGRIVLQNGQFLNISKINKIGNNIELLSSEEKYSENDDDFALSHRQAFGEGTFSKLKKLKIAVIGCSGTGSFIIEQLARLGVGELILVDPDIIELRNLNRIVNSFYNDVVASTPKVFVFEKAIKNMKTGTKVKAFHSNLYNYNVVNEVANSDILFGCMDSIDGRHLLNRISNFYLLPFFDLGVKLVSDGNGGIENIVGTVHYLQPGKSTLQSRNVYTLNGLYSADLFRTDPKEYQKQIKEKYIKGIDVEKPAVISINNQISALAINDFLARIHQYRYEENSNYASTSFNFCDWSLVYNDETSFNQINIFNKYVGRGDMYPLLDMPVFSKMEKPNDKD